MSLRRRQVLIGLGAAALAAGTTAGAQPNRFDAAHVLQPDGPALMLLRYQAAGSALDRLAARPGAWYGLLYLPLAPQVPVEVVLRSRHPGHSVQLQALDLAPGESPQAVVLLPVHHESMEPAQWRSRFMLPAQSSAEGVFLLIEQWRADFSAPPPLWVRARSAGAQAPAPRPDRPPWWSDAASARVEAPASPLTQAQRERAAFELPIWGARPAMEAPPPVWKETPR